MRPSSSSLPPPDWSKICGELSKIGDWTAACKFDEEHGDDDYDGDLIII